ncbi:hypothetical protein CVT26_012947 [Gymnopilus dilepis]|uniref:Uncharacterized protein n=1 Tax=Gymnopilus dilepis TaxID=231916 RepID=A0A409Y495_9AGAR|nr:hypothetical protein CVT26_012947 [Gymnopilus dilepis]
MANSVKTLSLPYIVYMVFLSASIAIQFKHPSSIDRRNGLYCTVSGIPLYVPDTFGMETSLLSGISRRYSVPISSVIFLALIMGFEVSILLRYYSGRKLIASSFPLATTTTSRGLIIRITLFNVYLVFTLSASVVFLLGKIEAWAYMIQASVPLAAFAVFATQKNVVRTWLFWVGAKEASYSGRGTPPFRQATTEDLNLSLPTLSIITIDGQVP